MDVRLVQKMVAKINYSALVGAVAEIRSTQLLSEEQLPILPPERPQDCDLVAATSSEGDDDTNQTAILEALHVVLFNIHVLEGALICPDTGRRFPIKDGIPNMILHADEI